MPPSAPPDYLEEGFDATSLTVARLRQILFAHGVVLSSHARKADLVSAFDAHIASQRRVLAERWHREGHAPADGAGIIDMRSPSAGVQSVHAQQSATSATAAVAKPRKSNAGSGSESEGMKSAPSSAAKKARGRRGSRVASGAMDREHPTPGSASYSRSSATAAGTASGSRSASPNKPVPKPPKSILSNSSDREGDGGQSDSSSAGRKRRSSGSKGGSLRRRTSVTFNPLVDYRDDSGDDEDEDGEDTGNFSAINPFQRGSASPEPPQDKKSPAKGRQSAPARTTASPRVSSAAASPALRRSTPGTSSKGAGAPKQAGTPGLALLRNFMDPALAASTPPRSASGSGGGHSSKASSAAATSASASGSASAASNVLRRIVSAGRGVANSVTGRNAAANEDEGDATGDDYTDTEGEDDDEEDNGEGEDDAQADDGGTTADSSFNVATDPSPSIHALREKRKRQGARSSLSRETAALWASAAANGNGNGKARSPRSSAGHVVSSAADKGKGGRRVSGGKSARRSSGGALSLLSPGGGVQRWGAVLLALYVLFVAFVAVRETRELGYCDPGADSNAITAARAAALAARPAGADEATEPDVGLASLVPARWLPQTCTPCPSHGVCSAGRFVGCGSSDFVLAPSLPSRIPLLRAAAPLAWLRPACVPDTHKLVLALELGAELERGLADWHGQVVCGYHPPHDALLAHVRGSAQQRTPAKGAAAALRSRPDAGALPARLLKADLHARMDADVVDDAYFEQLWALALAEYERSGDVRRIRVAAPADEADGDGEEEDSDLLYAPRAITTLRCAVKLRLRAFLRRFRLLGGSLLAVVVGAAWLRQRLGRRARDAARTAELVQVALERLQEQEYNHAVQPALHPEPFLATAQLRDHVLAREHSTKARKRLWARVAKIVEENANVRTRQAQRRGEWARVWEWIGGAAGTPHSAPHSGAASPVRSHSPGPEMTQKV